MTDYVPDVKKYTATVDEAAVAAIVKYCGIALRRPDSSMVSATHPKEMATVRDGFAAKKLGLKRSWEWILLRKPLAQNQHRVWSGRNAGSLPVQGHVATLQFG